MKYDFVTVADSASASAFKTCADKVMETLNLNYYDDTISMWIADMDFVVAPEIVNALKSRADLATFGYSGFTNEYYDSIISWFGGRFDMKFDRSEIVYTTGTVTALRNVIRAFTNEGDGVITQPPVYFPFRNVTVDTGRTILENYLLVDENNNYSIDFEDFEKKCADPRTKLFIFCNPHNPVGQIWDKETSQRLLDICRANNVLFFSDEVHAEIIRKDATFVSALNLDHAEDVIVSTAINKPFNVGGLHVTNLIIKNVEMRNKFTKFMGEVLISPFAHAATIAAYTKCGEWLDEMNSVLDDNLAYMDKFFKERMPRVRFNLPAATYLAWVDFRGYGIEESELVRSFGEEAHLILEGGSMFGVNSAGIIRMNIACPKSVLIEVLNRLEKLLEK